MCLSFFPASSCDKRDMYAPPLRGEPTVSIVVPPYGGSVGPSLINDLAVDKASKKVAALAGRDGERHLIVLVNHDYPTAGGLALTDTDSPDELPELPPEVTDVWLSAVKSLLWHFSVPERTWRIPRSSRSSPPMVQSTGYSWPRHASQARQSSVGDRQLWLHPWPQPHIRAEHGRKSTGGGIVSHRARLVELGPSWPAPSMTPHRTLSVELTDIAYISGFSGSN
jgi:hypothetical protein